MSKILRAFTLIELLVVISIIGILLTLASVSFSKVQMKARDSQRKEDLKALNTAIVLYYSDNNHYPPSESIDISDSSFFSSNSTEFKSALTPIYIKEIPSDPFVNIGNLFAFESKTINNILRLGNVEASHPPGSPGTPRDRSNCPSNNEAYCYVIDPDGRQYTLWAQLENLSDPDIGDDPVCRDNPVAFFGAGTTFNYCIHSPDL